MYIDFRWSELNFGWNLSDVLKKKEIKKEEYAMEEEKVKEIIKTTSIEKIDNEPKEDDVSIDGEGKTEGKEWIEIGMWSNDMLDTDIYEHGSVRYGSPTNWLSNAYDDEYSSDCDDSLSLSDSASEGGMHIEFGADNIAEALDYDKICLEENAELTCSFATWYNKDAANEGENLQEYYQKFIESNKEKIYEKQMVIVENQEFTKINNKDCNQIMKETTGLKTPPIMIYTSSYQEATFKVNII